jgi:hypothetical protein
MELPYVQLPGNWKGFLRDNDNKTHMFEFVTNCISEKQCGAGKQLDNVQCRPRKIKDSMQPCSHEEVDTRVTLHADDCA